MFNVFISQQQREEECSVDATLQGQQFLTDLQDIEFDVYGRNHHLWTQNTAAFQSNVSTKDLEFGQSGPILLHAQIFISSCLLTLWVLFGSKMIFFFFLVINTMFPSQYMCIACFLLFCWKRDSGIFIPHIVMSKFNLQPTDWAICSAFAQNRRSACRNINVYHRLRRNKGLREN